MRFCFSKYTLGGQSLVITPQELSLLFVLYVGVGWYGCGGAETEIERQAGAWTDRHYHWHVVFLYLLSVGIRSHHHTSFVSRE